MQFSKLLKTVLLSNARHICVLSQGVACFSSFYVSQIGSSVHRSLSYVTEYFLLCFPRLSFLLYYFKTLPYQALTGGLFVQVPCPLPRLSVYFEQHLPRNCVSEKEWRLLRIPLCNSLKQLHYEKCQFKNCMCFSLWLISLQCSNATSSGSMLNLAQ